MAKDKPPKADVSRETLDDEPPFDPSTEEIEEFAPSLVIRRRKSNAGRPPKYRPEYAKIAGAMLRRGSTVAEIAEAFGVTNATVYYWRTKHVEFFEQFSGITEADVQRAEKSLADRANGYSYDSVKVFNHKGVPLIVKIKEHVPPDIAAIKHLLAVKRPETWRIKEEVELTGDEAFKRLLMEMSKGKKDDSSEQT